MKGSVCAQDPSVTPISCLREEVMLTMHEIVGARRQRAHSDRSSWWLDGGDYRSRRLVPLPVLSPFVFPFLFGVLRYPLGSCIPRTRVLVYAMKTRASRRLDARFHGIRHLLGKCHRSSWIMSPDFRSASIGEGLFRESPLARCFRSRPTSSERAPVS